MQGFQEPELNIEQTEKFVRAASQNYSSVKITEINRSTYSEDHDNLFRFADYTFLARDLDIKGILYSKAWLSSGYFMWKPYFIYQELLKIPRGEYLHYHDFSLHKYPVYIYNIACNPSLFVKRLGKKSILTYIEIGKQLGHDVKSDLIDKFLLSKFQYGFWAGSLFIRHDSSAIRFIKDWVMHTNIHNALPTQHGISQLNHHSSSKPFHSADQAVLSCMILSLAKQNACPCAMKRIFQRNINRNLLIAYIDFFAQVLMSKIFKMFFYLNV